jgi:hypothetical protein
MVTVPSALAPGKKPAPNNGEKELWTLTRT